MIAQTILRVFQILDDISIRFVLILFLPKQMPKHPFGIVQKCFRHEVVLGLLVLNRKNTRFTERIDSCVGIAHDNRGVRGNHKL